MSDASTTPMEEIPVETSLRKALAQGDAVLGTAAPILGHLVLKEADSLFSDEIVAHVRGMASSIAAQMLTVSAQSAGEEDPSERIAKHKDAMVAVLLSDDALLFHLHALSIERQLAIRLDQRCAIDTVLSPLLQALIASDDSATSSTAMAILAAQSRFMQQQRRMELPLKELPGDLFQSVLEIWRTRMGGDVADETSDAEAILRGGYDEGNSRIGLLSRLVSNMGNGARAALFLDHAGVAIFLTALGFGSRQGRDLAALSTTDGQVGRLILALRAAGLKPAEIAEQLVDIHPDSAPPEGLEMLRVDRAIELLGTVAGGIQS